MTNSCIDCGTQISAQGQRCRIHASQESKHRELATKAAKYGHRDPTPPQPAPSRVEALAARLLDAAARVARRWDETGGTWRFEQGCPYPGEPVGWVMGEQGEPAQVAECYDVTDAEYIALANPANVRILATATLALGPCVRALERARPYVAERAGKMPWGTVTDEIVDRIDAALLAARAACAGEG